MVIPISCTLRDNCVFSMAGKKEKKVQSAIWNKKDTIQMVIIPFHNEDPTGQEITGKGR